MAASLELWRGRTSLDGWTRTATRGFPTCRQQVAALFTEDAAFASEAFQPPWRGRDEIVRRWTAGIKQDVEMTYDVLATEGDLALVHWHVFTRNAGDPIRTEYDGVIALRFAEDGRCRDHREWFFRRELP